MFIVVVKELAVRLGGYLFLHNFAVHIRRHIVLVANLVHTNLTDIQLTSTVTVHEPPLFSHYGSNLTSIHRRRVVVYQFSLIINIIPIQIISIFFLITIELFMFLSKYTFVLFNKVLLDNILILRFSLDVNHLGILEHLFCYLILELRVNNAIKKKNSLRDRIPLLSLFRSDINTLYRFLAVRHPFLAHDGINLFPDIRVILFCKDCISPQCLALDSYSTLFTVNNYAVRVENSVPEFRILIASLWRIKTFNNLVSRCRLKHLRFYILNSIIQTVLLSVTLVIKAIAAADHLSGLHPSVRTFRHPRSYIILKIPSTNPSSVERTASPNLGTETATKAQYCTKTRQTVTPRAAVIGIIAVFSNSDAISMKTSSHSTHRIFGIHIRHRAVKILLHDIYKRIVSLFVYRLVASAPIHQLPHLFI